MLTRSRWRFVLVVQRLSRINHRVSVNSESILSKQGLLFLIDHQRRLDICIVDPVRQGLKVEVVVPQVRAACCVLRAVTRRAPMGLFYMFPFELKESANSPTYFSIVHDKPWE